MLTPAAVAELGLTVGLWAPLSIKAAEATVVRVVGTDMSTDLIRVSADVGENARKAAVNQARAQGYRNVTVFQVRQVGPREYEVELNVTN